MRYPLLCIVLLAPWLAAQQPTMIKDINTVPVSGSNTQPSFPNQFHRHEALVFFTANDGTHGRELWRTDGTAAGTSMVVDIQKGVVGSDVRELTTLGKLLLFHTSDGQNGRDLWATEGSANSTRRLRKVHLSGESIGLIAFGDVALFQGRSSPSVEPSLWRTDGTAKGTFEIKMPKPIVRFGNPIEFQGRIYFAGGRIAVNKTPDVELWVTDGTANGTRLVKDVQPGGTSSTPFSSFPRDLTVMGGRLYFHALSSGKGLRLWRTDGTAKGTVLVNPVSPISALHGPHDLTAADDKLFFGLNSRLWVSDGTTRGTRALGPTFTRPRFGPFHAVAGGVLFTAPTTAGGNEAWGSNGVGIGTTDIEPGPTSSNPGSYARIGVRELFLTAFTNKHGYELWTVGRDLKPRFRHDINTAPVSKTTGSSSPYGFTMLNGRVIFAADDGSRGHELWSLFPGATSQPFGQACGPVGQRPQLDSSDDPVLGRLNSYMVRGAPASANGLMLVGLPARTSLAFPGGCRLYPDLRGVLSLPLRTLASGAANATIPTPNDVGLVGLTAAMQAVVATGNSVAFSNALHLTAGR